MSQQQDDTEKFFAELAGRTSDDDAQTARAAALRKALQAQLDTIRTAEQAGAEDLSAEDRERMENVKRQLLAAGVFDATTPEPRRRTMNWLRALWRSGGAGPQWAMVAASLLVVAGVLLQLTLPPSVTPGIERGAADAVLWTTDAAATAQELAQELNRAGADAVAVQINQTEWSVRIDKIENRAAVLETLTRAGVEVTDNRIDRVIVREQR